MAVADGASEIDIVISRDAVLTGDWQRLYDEVPLVGGAVRLRHGAPGGGYAAGLWRGSYESHHCYWRVGNAYQW